MPYPPITPLPTPPSRSQSPETFSADADTFLGALPDFQSDANALGGYLDGVAAAVDADAVSADADAAAAAASQAAAALSESNAAASEANAAASEVNAAASEAAAAISEANAAASELAAASSAAEAEAIVAGVGFKDVVFINAAMSPYTVTGATNGKLLACDTTAGPIVVNLPLISSITTPYTFGAKKTTSDVNALTINCAGSDTFDDGTASKALTTPSGYTLLPDADLSPDVWAAIGFGGANAGPATSSGLTMSSGKLLGRTTAGAGAIEELPIASYSNPTTAGIAVTDGSTWQTSKAAPTGDIVGTTDTQTLRNKTLANPDVIDGLRFNGSAGLEGQALISQGAGLAPVWGSVGSFQVGDIIQTTRTLSAPTWLPATGGVVSQTAYPSLYTSVGLISDGISYPWTINTEDSISLEFKMAKMVYGAGLYISITGGDGVISTSKFGYGANRKTISSNEVFTNLATNGSLVVANGYNSSTYNNIVYTSTDGVNWTFSNTNMGSSTFVVMEYLNGQFVAITATGTAYTSSDGITWTAKGATGISGVMSITYGNGIYIASGNSGVLRTSSDLINWTTRTTGVTTAITALGFGNGVFVFYAETSGEVKTSTDGVTWTTRVTLTPAGYYASIIYANNRFVLVQNGSTSNQIRYSTNSGTTWNIANAPYSSSYSSIAYGPYGFVSGNLASSSFPIISTDGVTWLAAQNALNFACGASSGSLSLVNASGAGYYASSDGVTWALRSASTNNHANAIYANGLFVFVGVSGIFTTVDGVTVTQRSSVTCYGIAYGNGLFVATGASGAMYTSPDGITWTTRSVAGYSTTTFSSITYGLGRFMATSSSSGGYGFVFTSTDGINWVAVPTGLPLSVTGATYGITFGDDKFVIACSDGVLISSDGITFNSAKILGFANSGRVAYAGGNFIAYSGTSMYYSRDGYNWDQTISNVKTTRVVFATNSSYIYAVSGGIGYRSFYTYNPTTEFALPTGTVTGMAGVKSYIKAN